MRGAVICARGAKQRRPRLIPKRRVFSFGDLMVRGRVRGRVGKVLEVRMLQDGSARVVCGNAVVVVGCVRRSR